MEALKRKWGSLSLRRFFTLTVLGCICLVAFLSGIIIWGCAAFRHWLLPDPNAVYLTVEETWADGSVTTGEYLLEYGDSLESLPRLIGKGTWPDGSETPAEEKTGQIKCAVQKVEKSSDMLSPKRKLAYYTCGIVMAAAPAVLAFAGIILCSMYFYRRKLKRPMELLSDAAGKIAEQDLDFTLNYDCGDEMGALCSSFEKMRKALHENNRKMWEMLEERRLLQASVAHDLRNPIAIIEGYAEYLEAGFAEGEMNREKGRHIAQNLNMAAKRLEQYTESVRRLNQSEDTELNCRTMPARELPERMAEDFRLLAQKSGISLYVSRGLPDEEIRADDALLHRILENAMSNALRYAKREIRLGFTLSEHILSVTVADDGKGFPPEILQQREKTLLFSGEDGHMGIGIAVSRLLCKKHGGSLELFNTPDGACVKINICV